MNYFLTKILASIIVLCFAVEDYDTPLNAWSVSTQPDNIETSTNNSDCNLNGCEGSHDILHDGQSPAAALSLPALHMIGLEQVSAPPDLWGGPPAATLYKNWFEIWIRPMLELLPVLTTPVLHTIALASATAAAALSPEQYAAYAYGMPHDQAIRNAALDLRSIPFLPPSDAAMFSRGTPPSLRGSHQIVDNNIQPVNGIITLANGAGPLILEGAAKLARAYAAIDSELAKDLWNRLGALPPDRPLDELVSIGERKGTEAVAIPILLSPFFPYAKWLEKQSQHVSPRA